MVHFSRGMAALFWGDIGAFGGSLRRASPGGGAELVREAVLVGCAVRLTVTRHYAVVPLIMGTSGFMDIVIIRFLVLISVADIVKTIRLFAFAFSFLLFVFRLLLAFFFLVFLRVHGHLRVLLGIRIHQPIDRVWKRP